MGPEGLCVGTDVDPTSNQIDIEEFKDYCEKRLENNSKGKTKREVKRGAGDLYEILTPRKPWAYDGITQGNEENYASKISQESTLHYDDMTNDLHDEDAVYDATYVRPDETKTDLDSKILRYARADPGRAWTMVGAPEGDRMAYPEKSNVPARLTTALRQK